MTSRARKGGWRSWKPSGLVLSLAGLGAALGIILLALHNDPSWAGPAAAVGSLIAIPLLFLDRSWPAREAARGAASSGGRNARHSGSSRRPSAFGHVCAALLGGFCLPLALGWLVSELHSGSPIQAVSYITPSGNVGVAANSTATFAVTVPARRRFLVISFTAQQSAGGSDNCINGATINLAEAYGASDTTIRNGLRLDRSYRVAVPAVTRFRLLVTFVPQPGFTSCSENITVATAQFQS